MTLYYIDFLSVNLQRIVLIVVIATHTISIYFYPRFHFEGDLGSLAVGDAPSYKLGCMINACLKQGMRESFNNPPGSIS
jgi:hypothetical protein